MLPTGDLVPVVVTERAGRVLREGVAVALALGGPHEGGDDLEVPFGDVGCLAPRGPRGEGRCRVPAGRSGWAAPWFQGTEGIGRHQSPCKKAHFSGTGSGSSLAPGSFPEDGAPPCSGLPGSRSRRPATGHSRSCSTAGTTLCVDRLLRWLPEIVYPCSEKSARRVARAAYLALVRPRTAVRLMGHLEAEGRNSPPPSARSTAAPASRRRAAPRSSCSDPGFLLGRSREDAIASVVEQLGTLRERL